MLLIWYCQSRLKVKKRETKRDQLYCLYVDGWHVLPL